MPGPLTTRIQKIFDEPSASGYNDSYKLHASTSCSPPSGSFCVKDGVNGINGQVSAPGVSTPSLACHGKTASAAECESACAQDRNCIAFTWVSPSFGQAPWRNLCYLRHGGTSATSKAAGIVTGLRGACGGAPSCANFVTTSADCFRAAAGLPALANFSLTTHEVASGSIPPGCTITAGEMSAKVVFNSNNVSEACCAVNASSSLTGSATALESDVSLRLSVRGAEGKISITMTGLCDNNSCHVCAWLFFFDSRINTWVQP